MKKILKLSNIIDWFWVKHLTFEACYNILFDISMIEYWILSTF